MTAGIGFVTIFKTKHATGFDFYILVCIRMYYQSPFNVFPLLPPQNMTELTLAVLND